MKRLCDSVVTFADAKLLFVVNLRRRFVRLVQTLHADVVSVRRMKSLDVKRGYGSYVFDVSLSFVSIEKRSEVLIRSLVTTHLFHDVFNLGPELAGLREHAVMKVPVTIRNRL